jgi:hypothetical protein
MPARERDRLVKGSDPYGDACTEKMRRLVKLRGVGAEFAPVLTPEVFYRSFQNRRQVASYVGLTPAKFNDIRTFAKITVKSDPICLRTTLALYPISRSDRLYGLK